MDTSKCIDCDTYDLIYDYNCAEYICTHCGVVVHERTHDEDIKVNAYQYNIIQTCYQPKFHINERLSQWRQEEPDIDDDDWNKINAAAREYQAKGNRIAEKSDIQRILRTLGPKFSRKYLEKWLTIITRITRKQFYPIPSLDLAHVVQMNFLCCLNPFYANCPKGRNHLPNYNYIILQILYILNPKYEEDYKFCFPLLRSPKKIKRLDEMWKPICEHNRWQYRPMYTVNNNKNTKKPYKSSIPSISVKYCLSKSCMSLVSDWIFFFSSSTLYCFLAATAQYSLHPSLYSGGSLALV